MLRIAHIINPVKVESSHDLFMAQPITFESMRIAKEEATGIVQVDLLTTQFPEDHEIIPDYFQVLPDLQRSVLEIRSFSNPRKYPLIADILELLYDHSHADYFLFTNVDIGLRPEFYVEVKKWLDKGNDALIINRRRVSSLYNTVAHLPEIYEQKGKSHPGFDCFIFKRELVQNMQLGNICVGVPFIGVTLAHNLFCFAESPLLLDNEFLTFHIGMDVMPRRDKEYYWYNRKEFNKINKEFLWEQFDIRKFPYSTLSFPVRYFKWGMNPSLFIFMNFKLELRKLFRR